MSASRDSCISHVIEGATWCASRAHGFAPPLDWQMTVGRRNVWSLSHVCLCVFIRCDAGLDRRAGTVIGLGMLPAV